MHIQSCGTAIDVNFKDVGSDRDELLQATKKILQKQLVGQSYRLIILQHILPDTVTFLRMARNAGINVAKVFAKPNSIHKPSLETLVDEGFAVSCLDYGEMEGTEVLDKAILQEHALAVQYQEQLVCVDVGGYFCEPLRRLSPKKLPNFKGVVEVTTFGHNRYSAKVKYLAHPVISLAKSPLKNAEALIVGESATLATDLILRENGYLFVGSKVGVLGFGAIGHSTAKALRSKGHLVTVFDTDPIKRVAAKLEGFGVSSSKQDLLGNCDFVFSATATRAVEVADLKHFQNGLVLVSVGSKANEFDIDGLVDAAETAAIDSDGISCLTYAGGTKLKVLRMGKAVNFHVQSCPDEVMDLVFAETVACMATLSTDLPKSVLSELSDESRKEIAAKWLQRGTYERN